jgi:hypothetical protein
MMSNALARYTVIPAKAGIQEPDVPSLPLETRASRTLQTVMAHEPVSEAALRTLLDWLDKVRIGLWLGDMMRNKDFLSVERYFHISQRMGQKDRCAFLFTSRSPEKVLLLPGYSLSCFIFIHFVWITYHWIIPSKHFG